MSSSTAFVGIGFVVVLLLGFAALVSGSPTPALPADNSYVEEPLTVDEQYAWWLITVNATYGTTEVSHAPERHGDTYEAVRNCAPKWKIVIRPSKYVDICDMGDGRFGFRPWKQIGGSIEKGNAHFEEITAYVRDEIKCVDDLIAFAEKLGRSLIEY